MSEPVKVLYFVDRMLRGGIQSLVIDWVSRFDKNKIHVDFLLLDDGNKYELEDTLKKMGCKVYKLNGVWINTPLDFIKEAKALDIFFNKHHDYKIVHMHSTSKNYMVLKYAKKYGIPIRIIHSHASDFQTNNFLKKIIGNILKIKLSKYSTDFFACSYSAGKWLFSKKIIMSKKFRIINNSIDYNKFKFDVNIRKKIRNELNINDEQVLIGHVGRFTDVKNQDFLVDVFNKYLNFNEKYVLIFCGTGVLENQIKNKVKRLKLTNKIFFEGYKNNINEYMQAIDIFVLPSKYEGLGLVAIEAQASGMPCIVSDMVAPEVKITDNLFFLPLNNQKKWANKILSVNISRKDVKEQFKANKYLIEDTICELESFYIN